MISLWSVCVCAYMHGHVSVLSKLALKTFPKGELPKGLWAKTTLFECVIRSLKWLLKGTSTLINGAEMDSQADPAQMAPHVPFPGYQRAGPRLPAGAARSISLPTHQSIDSGVSHTHSCTCTFHRYLPTALRDYTVLTVRSESLLHSQPGGTHFLTPLGPSTPALPPSRDSPEGHPDKA